MRKAMRMLRGLVLLILLAAAAGAAYMYLAPMLEAEEALVYEAYTVSRGGIATEKSFSATISVFASEKHQNTSRATSIREIYVTNGQDVREGDKLMLLDNGTVIRAGLDGVVTEMRFDTTDWLWNNVDLIQISDLTHLKVTLSVDEYDVRNVTAGQTCYVSIVPTGEVFETVIEHVDRVSSSSGQVAYYDASAQITVPDTVLPGMTASVTIPSDSVTDVLVLDLAALAFDEEKQPYVLRKTDTGYEQVPVTTGLTDGMQVEIVSGLAEGDEVWAVSGKETVRESFSLQELYTKYFGQKVVIQDMTGGTQNDRNSGAEGADDAGGSWGGRADDAEGAAEGEDAAGSWGGPADDAEGTAEGEEPEASSGAPADATEGAAEGEDAGSSWGGPAGEAEGTAEGEDNDASSGAPADATEGAAEGEDTGGSWGGPAGDAEGTAESEENGASSGAPTGETDTDASRGMPAAPGRENTDENAGTGETAQSPAPRDEERKETP